MKTLDVQSLLSKWSQQARFSSHIPILPPGSPTVSSAGPAVCLQQVQITNISRRGFNRCKDHESFGGELSWTPRNSSQRTKLSTSLPRAINLLLQAENLWVWTPRPHCLSHVPYLRSIHLTQSWYGHWEAAATTPTKMPQQPKLFKLAAFVNVDSVLSQVRPVVFQTKSQMWVGNVVSAPPPITAQVYQGVWLEHSCLVLELISNT